MMQGALVGALAQELVKYVAAAIQEQGQYAAQFPNKFRELEKQMTFMQAFVADASKKKDNQETVNTTIAALQELIYQADDLVTDCQIREYYQKKKGGSCFLSLSEMCFRLETGKNLAQINSEIRRMKENLSSYFGPITAQMGGDNSPRGNRWSSPVFNRSEIVGIGEDAEIIKDWIVKQSEPLLHVAIVGMGGLGKTTLAQKIYNDPILTKRYQKKIWVSVSQPVNVVKIMESMLGQLGEKDFVPSESVMQTKISESLSDKTYLIVLDDVWSIDDGWWGQLSKGMPKPDENKNCIIITSRIKSVVIKMGVEEERVHQPRLLNEDESWELFCKVARISPNGEQKSLEDVGKAIAKKCGGLPLAIKTIGGLLSSKDKKTVIEWKRISENFHAKLTEDSNHSDGTASIIASLQLSYDELPARLKPCLVCFSIYPEDHEIDVDQLIHWWAGEGFVRSKTEETASELAFNCLSELISRCLVDVAQRRNFDGSAYTCKVHDMVRDLTIKIARNEEFSSFDEDWRQITNSSSRRLGVTSDTKLQNLRGNSKLRALLVIAPDRIGFKRDIELAKVHSLRVLDLSKVKLDRGIINLKDLWEWITSLKRLAYLNLREVANLSEVPSSIVKLWGLQVLILQECRHLAKLPKSIVKLPRLIFLDVGNCPLLKSLPQGFSQLSHLQELYGFKIAGSGNSAGSCLGELENLTELRILQIDITKESRIQSSELPVLEKLEKLKLLSINAGDCENSQDNNDILTKLDKLSPPPSIEELYLKHYLGETMPGWIKPRSLKKLQYLCMEHSRVKNMSKDFLGDAECESTDEVCKWDVKGLCLKFCQVLELSWDEVQKAMPEIRYLEISQCSSLRDFPFDVTSMGFWYKQDDNKDVIQKMLSTKTIESS